MGLRTLKIAAGGDAGAAETDLMVREKIKAAAELQTLALTGGLGLTPPRRQQNLENYRRKVPAIRQRLSESLRNDPSALGYNQLEGACHMSKREEIAPNGDKRYILPSDEGQIRTSVEEGASLSADSRHEAKADAKPGEGDRGDHKKK